MIHTHTDGYIMDMHRCFLHCFFKTEEEAFFYTWLSYKLAIGKTNWLPGEVIKHKV